MIEKIDRETKKEIAKIGMTATLGVTAVTAFMLKNKKMKYIHTGAGLALVGFSVWHHFLYQADKPAPQKKQITKTDKESVEALEG